MPDVSSLSGSTGTARWAGPQSRSTPTPPICSDEECAEKQKKREGSRKRLTVMLYLFPAIAILLVLLQAMGASG